MENKTEVFIFHPSGDTRIILNYKELYRNILSGIFIFSFLMFFVVD